MRKRERKQAAQSLLALRQRRKKEADEAAEQARREFLRRQQSAADKAEQSDHADSEGGDPENPMTGMVLNNPRRAATESIESVQSSMQRARIISVQRHAAEDAQAMQRGEAPYGFYDPNFNKKNAVNSHRPRNRLRGRVYDLVNHPYFDGLILLCIFLNTVTLAIPHYTTVCLSPADDMGRREEDAEGCIEQAGEMSGALQDGLELSNNIFLGIFTAEVVLKIYGLGWGQFSVDRFNLFDLVVVIFGFGEHLPFDTIPGGGGIISAFRIFRLARVFKAAKYWPSMQSLVATLIDTLPSLTYLTIVLILLLFIAACTGMQLFGDVGIPLEFRPNFGDFGTAMLTVFQILTGENWNDVMYMSVGKTHYGFVVYFIVIFVVGGFVILNLYLAILLSAFDCGEPPDFSLGWISELKSKVLACLCLGAVRNAKTQGGYDLELELDLTSLELEEDSDNIDFEDDSPEAVEDELSLSKGIANKEVERKVMHRRQKTAAIRKALRGKSLGCISKHSKLRLRLARIVHAASFDNAILVLIMVSTSILAFESPKLAAKGMSNTLVAVLLYADCTFTVLFIVEMMMKIIVYGFISTPSAYLKDSWNILDFFVVMISTFSLTMTFVAANSNLDIGWIRSLRALRALRPLRTIKRAPGMRLAVNTLFDCAPAFLNIGCVAFVIYLAFAIIGVEFFGGRFWRCNDESVDSVNECVGNFLRVDDSGINEMVPRKWENDPMNFDNTGQALLTRKQTKPRQQMCILLLLLLIIYYHAYLSSICSVLACARSF